MQERVEGQGRLETIAPPEKVWQVSYRFDIVTNIVRKPGSSAVAGRSDNTGAVLSLNRKPIPEGEYTLHTDDGEINLFRVLIRQPCAVPRNRLSLLSTAAMSLSSHSHTTRYCQPCFLRLDCASASRS